MMFKGLTAMPIALVFLDNMALGLTPTSLFQCDAWTHSHVTIPDNCTNAKWYTEQIIDINTQMRDSTKLEVTYPKN